MILKNGYYNGVITSIEVKEYENAEKKNKFKKLIIGIDLTLDKNEVKNVKCSYGLDSARDIFSNSGVKTDEAVGKTIRVYVFQKSIKNAEKTVTFNVATGLRFIDEKGNVIYEPNKQVETSGTGLDF
jgi:hypothetical protein